MREQWGKYMEFSGKMAFALERTKTNIAQIKIHREMDGKKQTMKVNWE